VMEQLALPFKGREEKLARDLIKEHREWAGDNDVWPWWDEYNVESLTITIKRYPGRKWFIREDGCITSDEGWL
jgi:hypothetical protein